jgi:hypothetical protein
MDEISKKQLAISVAKAAVGAVPWLGPSLNEAFFDYRSRVKQQRINAFLADLMAQLEHYETGSQDFEHLQSDAFGDFFESVLRKVAENRSSEKISRFKGVLVKEVRSPSQTDFTETFLDIISKVNETEIAILVKYDQFDKKEEDKEIPEYRLRPEEIGLDPGTLAFYTQDLISKALLIDIGMGIVGTRYLQILSIY